MLSFDILCEQRIVEAIRQGEFDDLPGAGQPLDLSEDPMVPEDMRMANRIMKNAGFTPPAIGLRREVAELQAQLELLGEEARAQAVKRLAVLMMRLSMERGQVVNLSLEEQYWERLKQKAA
jgi:hypothetical protein